MRIFRTWNFLVFSQVYWSSFLLNYEIKRLEKNGWFNFLFFLFVSFRISKYIMYFLVLRRLLICYWFICVVRISMTWNTEVCRRLYWSLLLLAVELKKITIRGKSIKMWIFLVQWKILIIVVTYLCRENFYNILILKY